MLRKMLIQGVAAAAIIAGAAGLYAARAVETAQAPSSQPAVAGPAKPDTGYLDLDRARPDKARAERHERRKYEHDARHDSHDGRRRDRRVKHDDD